MKNIKFLCLILVFILLMQAFVVAGDSGKSILSAVAVVVGVALVVTCVGAVAVGAATWSTTVTTVVGDISVTTLADVGLGLILAGEAASNVDPIGYQSQESGQEPSKNLKFEISINNSFEKNKKVAVIKLKDSTSGDYYAPSGDTSLWVSHSNNQIDMLVGGNEVEVAQVKSAAIAGDKFVNAYDVPAVIKAGFPAIINYTLQKQSQFVRMEVLDSSGNIVYGISESSPNPAKPIPFVWNGKDMSGNKVQSGAYSVRLKAVKSDGSAEYSPLSVMTVGDTVPANEERQISFDNQGNAYLTFFNSNDLNTEDSITVKLKDKDGNIALQDTQVVNFKDDGQGNNNVSQKPLNFSVNVTGVIEGYKVKLEFPRGDINGSKIARVTAMVGDTNQITYEYDLNKKTAKVASGTYAATYSAADADPHKRDFYFNIIYTMKYLIQEVYKQKGITYDYQTNSLAFSPELKNEISATTSGNVIALKTASGKYNYDIAQNTITVLEGEDIIAGTYSWDESNNMACVPDKTVVSASRVSSEVKAMWLSDTQTITVATIAFPFNFENFQLRADVARRDAPEEIYPMERPKEPTIDDVNWLNHDLGVVEVKGTADLLNSKVEIVINGQKFGITGTSSSNWSFTNNSYPLHSGENKINIIATALRNTAQVETGDITVYSGDSTTPDLILLSPRDRQVVESESMSPSSPQKLGITFKGKTLPGVTISIPSNSINVDSLGIFDATVKLDSLYEGNNQFSISILGNKPLSINKSLIGAYKFYNNYKSNAYVLRKGDFVFNKKGLSSGDIRGALDWIPFDPDHSGIYVGNGNIREAVWNNIKLSSLKDDSGWTGYGFYIASQIPIIIPNEEETRGKVAKDIEDFMSQYPSTMYDLPFLNIFSLRLLGHYNGANGGFYCSELAWWAWKKQAIDFGVKKVDLLYPPESSFYEGTNEDRFLDLNSILPAYLCQKTMKVKEVNK